MVFLTHIFIHFLLCWSAYCQVTGEDYYSLKKNVEVAALNSSGEFYKAESRTLLTCAGMCAAEDRCLSALHNKQSSGCHLFSSRLTTNRSSDETGLSYIESPYCTYIENFYVAENPSCLKFMSPYIYQDCQEAFEKGERNSGAEYLLRPEQSWRLIRAVCQFDEESGWTLIQRRLDGSVDFYRNWDDYSDGFGTLSGEYWIGLEGIHYLTRRNQKLSIYLEAHDGESRTANYSTFHIDDETQDYRSHVCCFSGDVDDSFAARHDNKIFETYDHRTSSCPLSFRGGWWYSGCLESNLNGIWHEGGNFTKYADGAVWKYWKGYQYSYKTIYMRLSR